MTNKSKLDDINKNYFRAHKLWFKLIELKDNLASDFWISDLWFLGQTAMQLKFA